MDVFIIAGKILSLAVSGTTYTDIMRLVRDLKQSEIRWVLESLLENKLLDLDDASSTYWATVEGTKFLELQFHLDRILEVQKSLT